MLWRMFHESKHDFRGRMTMLSSFSKLLKKKKEKRKKRKEKDRETNIEIK